MFILLSHLANVLLVLQRKAVELTLSDQKMHGASLVQANVRTHEHLQARKRAILIAAPR
ncbi:hypothetical protein D3C81_2220160 [compost metagenome]